jgi:hypothetical protein
MIWIYRTAPSNSAVSLCEVLGAKRLRSHRLSRVRESDSVIAWGEAYSGPARVLNGTALQDKIKDALKLKEAGVPTIEVAMTRPSVGEFDAQPFYPLFDVASSRFNRAISRDEVARHIAELQQWLSDNPEPLAEEWLGRLRHHIGGRDLLNPPERPDYYVRKETITKEFRVHSFRGTSIRAGIKRADRPDSHGWIRSLDAGWKISYDGTSVKQRHRDLAHDAVRALGLDFGAVDIGQRADGSLIVLEVNRAPGLDGGTILAYADAIKRWVDSNDSQ